MLGRKDSMGKQEGDRMEKSKAGQDRPVRLDS
jgi:hypothetical protein